MVAGKLIALSEVSESKWDFTSILENKKIIRKRIPSARGYTMPPHLVYKYYTFEMR